MSEIVVDYNELANAKDRKLSLWNDLYGGYSYYEDGNEDNITFRFVVVSYVPADIIIALAQRLGETIRVEGKNVSAREAKEYVENLRAIRVQNEWKGQKPVKITF